MRALASSSLSIFSHYSVHFVQFPPRLKLIGIIRSFEHRHRNMRHESERNKPNPDSELVMDAKWVERIMENAVL